MNDRTASGQQIAISISAVERDTGLSKDTLRVWERRYGFPQPNRDGFGERVYPLDQVDKLRVVKRLMDAGHRPGKIIGYSIDELQKIAETIVTPQREVQSESSLNQNLQVFLDLVKTHQVEELRRSLSQALLRMGLARFVTEVVAPL
ncbi:MAG: hypothetical protein RL341_1487, partial [Pseudomonadota bacterium]